MIRSERPSCSGLTLIELLVALVILAILGLMSWRGIDSALNSRDHIIVIEQRWQKLSRGFALIEHNLLQISERNAYIATPGAMPDFKLEKLADGQQRLVFWRMDPQQGARLTGFRLDDDKLMLLRWPHNVPMLAPGDDIKAESILDGVHNVRWAVLTANFQWTDIWPTGPTAAVGSLPRGIRIDMDIDNVGHIQRLFALH
ncbi:MAG: ral secretory pathway protein [Rhodocyclales bacterium]|nr:ral secretory pathway protein [Rhodocyclales bacterium]